MSSCVLHFCLFDTVAGMTVVPLVCGMYLAIGFDTSVLALSYIILGFDYNWYLKLIFLWCALLARSRKPKR